MPPAPPPLSILRTDFIYTSQKAQANNEIPDADCRKSYIGETGCPFVGTTYIKKKFKLESIHYTRSTRKASMTDVTSP